MDMRGEVASREVEGGCSMGACGRIKCTQTPDAVMMNMLYVFPFCLMSSGLSALICHPPIL